MKFTASSPEFNPYAAPLSDLDEPASDLYRIISTRVSLGEYRRLAAGLVSFLIVAFFRVFRVPAPFFFPFGFTRPRRLDLIEFDHLPPHIRNHWEGPLAEFEALGLHPAFAYSLPVTGSLKEAFAIILRADDGRLHGSLSYLRNQVGANTKEVVAATASSRLTDGQRVATSNARPFLNPPPEYQVRHLTGFSVKEVLSSHLEWVASMDRTPEPIAEDELPDAIIRSEQRHIDFQIERGVLAPMTAREARRLAKLSDAGPPQPATRLGKIATFLGKLEWIGMSGLLLWLLLIFSNSTDAPRGAVDRFDITLGFLGVVFALKAARFLLRKIDRHRSKTSHADSVS
ncbi:MAG: hypothetical protein ABI353_21815 [Isosphaeraceae bacterium]